MGSIDENMDGKGKEVTLLKIERDLDRVGLWRSDLSSIKIPELGIELMSAGSRPGLFATFCSLGDTIRKIRFDLCVKQSLGDGKRARDLRESLSSLEKGELSASLIVSDPYGFLFEEEKDDEEKEDEEKEEEINITTTVDTNLVEDEEQASILASFVNLVNRETATDKDERAVAAKPGTQISVLWPPDGKYYRAVVLSHEHNTNYPGVAVLYTETGELEQGVLSFRIHRH